MDVYRLGLAEASTALISAGHLIKSSQMPIVYHVLRMVQRNLIIAAHNLIVLAGVWPFVRWSVGPGALLSIIGLVLLYFFLVGSSLVIAIVCVRYRDVPPLIQVLTQFLFFASPVIWYPEKLTFGALILLHQSYRIFFDDSPRPNSWPGGELGYLGNCAVPDDRIPCSRRLYVRAVPRSYCLLGLNEMTEVVADQITVDIPILSIRARSIRTIAVAKARAIGGHIVNDGTEISVVRALGFRQFSSQ